MGADSTKCMSVTKKTSETLVTCTSKAPILKEVAVENSFAPWVGEWTYIVRNEVHSFDILAQNDQLIYLENMGMATMRGKVFLKKDGTTAKVVAKKMNFEIFLDRKKMVARYRTIGTKKWTKEISLLKVDEIDSDFEDVSCDEQSTLANTWRNQSMHDGPTDGSLRLVRDKSSCMSLSRGCSLRRAISLKYVKSKESDTDVEELYRRNTSKRSIRFAPDVINELKADLREIENS